MLTENYKVNLEIFEGPLDLLLHLIRKDDLNIYDIPIHHILEKYIEQMDLLKELDVDLAGEFILVASELSHIKSRLLLHKEDEEIPEEDPRSDLMARLLRYQKFKLAANWLDSRPRLGRDVFIRLQDGKPDVEIEMPSLEIDPFQLLNAFHEILKKAPKDIVHSVITERISMTQRIYQIMEGLQTDSALFESLFPEGFLRSDIIITFLAILEMGKLRMIRIYQLDGHGAIRIQKRME